MSVIKAESRCSSRTTLQADRRSHAARLRTPGTSDHAGTVGNDGVYDIRKQRAMSKGAGSTVAEVKGSHAVYVSQPRAVAAIIAKAAAGVALATR
jgi:hypothetical protein